MWPCTRLEYLERLPPLCSRFRVLQIQPHSLAIDQHKALIDELLPRAVILLVAHQSACREDELHRLTAARPRTGRPDARAEVDSIEIRLRLQRRQHRPDQVRNVLVERQ